MRARFWINTSVWICMAGGVRAAEISGRIILPNNQAAGEAVVYLQGDKKAEPMASAIVDQRNKTFIPHVCVVTRGTTVRFPNNDTVFHNVFAYFEAKRFDLGMYPRWETKTVTFDKAGLVSILCNVHSNMSAYIMVVDTPYFAVADRQGHFCIHDVPPGAYTLHAWQESGARVTQTLNLAVDKRALTVCLTRK